MKRFSLLALIVPLLVTAKAQAQTDELIISSWGGAYEQAQMAAYFEQFAEEHNVHINLKPYNGGIAALEFLDNPGEAGWDVIDLTESDALAACDNRLISELDKTVLKPAPDGTRAINDFVDGAFFKCGIAHLSYATVLAYDDRAFPNEKPNSVADFFDTEKFPGKRAIQRTPKGILEWVMLSYNVPVRQIYDLLSTERGFRLVTKRLNQLKDDIVWWEDGQKPVDLLRDGKVVMASGYYGRFYDAQINHGLPIEVIPDGQFLELSVWGIHRQARNTEMAKKFIGFATSTERMAAFSNLLPYGPTRESAYQRIGLRASTVASIVGNPAGSDLGGSRRIRADSEWYSGTEIIRNRWFNEILKSRGEPPIRQLRNQN